MIIFDRLQISDSGKLLYIDVHVNKASCFDNITIDKVIIQNSSQVSETDPLTPGSDYIYQLEVPENTRELHLALNSSTDFKEVLNTLSDILLFVYVVCKGAPCRLDEMTTLGVTFDETLLYQKVMQFTKELANNCSISKGFVDMILLWFGFKSAIETEHYIEAIAFWKKMFFGHHGIEGLSTYKPCGCHG